MSQASAQAWFNGNIVPREAGAPSVASINFHLGTSVFDGLMAYWNGDHYYLHRVTEHLERFRAGAARMGLDVPWSVQAMTDGIVSLLEGEPVGDQYIRPIAYRRVPELWVTGSEGLPVDVTIFTVRVIRDSDHLISCHVSEVERISSRAIPGQTKVSGAYVNSHYARKQAELAGYNDGIMLDRHGRVAEASAANFFAIREKTLITPPLNPDVFPGITRACVMELARESGIQVGEVDMTATDLMTVPAAFLCSTLMELRGVAAMNGRSLATAVDPIFQALVESFRALTHESRCRRAAEVKQSGLVRM